MSNKLDSILLGDNPFFGVNHLSQKNAREKASISQNFDNAVEVIKYSVDLGAGGMVVSTHPTLQDLIEKIQVKTDLIEKMEFYPILPYVQGYVMKVNEKGMINTLFDTLNQAGIKKKIKVIAKGGMGIVRKDISELLKTFIDIELLQIKNLKIKTVFFSDALVDLALGLNMKKVFETFQNHLHDEYNIEAGLVTKNFPRLIDKCEEWNLKIPYIMTSFNKVGFQMNPSRTEYEEYLNRYNGDIIAMSVLAGGYLKLEDALGYISTLKNIKHAVIGVSTKEHAKNTFEQFVKLTKDDF